MSAVGEEVAEGLSLDTHRTFIKSTVVGNREVRVLLQLQGRGKVRAKVELTILDAGTLGVDHQAFDEDTLKDASANHHSQELL
jgi:hypothetical protein